MNANSQPWTLLWVEPFTKSEFGMLRFKILNTGFPKFNFPEHLIDVVDLEELNEIEELRIPLFIGSQFGIHPPLKKLNEIPKEGRIMAILYKSLLSGHVAGLKIVQISFEKDRYRLQQIIFFPNE